MKAYSYIMALSNYNDSNELHLENQKKVVYLGNEELYIDEIYKARSKNSWIWPYAWKTWN